MIRDKFKEIENEKKTNKDQEISQVPTGNLSEKDTSFDEFAAGWASKLNSS